MDLDPESTLRDMVEENLRLAKDNNRMLHAIRRAAFFGAVGRILFWIVILGIPAPVISSIVPPGTATSTNPVLNMFGLPSSEAVKQVTDTLRTLAQAAQHAAGR